LCYYKKYPPTVLLNKLQPHSMTRQPNPARRIDGNTVSIRVSLITIVIILIVLHSTFFLHGSRVFNDVLKLSSLFNVEIERVTFSSELSSLIRQVSKQNPPGKSQSLVIFLIF